MNPSIQKIAIGSALVVGLLGCNAPQTATLSGSLENGSFALDNPVVIAEASTGARYVSYVHPDLTFAITVPIADTYSLSLANSTRTSEFRVVSQVNITTDEDLSRYVTISDPIVADVGTVQPIDWNATTTTGGLGTLSAPSGNPGSAHSAGHGKPGDDGNDAAPDDVTTCDPVSVLSAKTTLPIKGVHGGGGSAAPMGSGGGAGQVKVTICHVPPGNPANAHTITVGAPAVPAHLAHGDYLGACLPGPTQPGNPQCPPSGGDGSSTDGGTTTTGGGSTTTGGTPPGGTTTTTGGGLPPGGTNTTGGGSGPSGSHCVINADCAAGLVCIESTCGIVVL